MVDLECQNLKKYIKVFWVRKHKTTDIWKPAISCTSRIKMSWKYVFITIAILMFIATDLPRSSQWFHYLERQKSHFSMVDWYSGKTNQQQQKDTSSETASYYTDLWWLFFSYVHLSGAQNYPRLYQWTWPAWTLKKAWKVWAAPEEENRSMF